MGSLLGNLLAYCHSAIGSFLLFGVLVLLSPSHPVHIFAPSRDAGAPYSFSADRRCNSKPPVLAAPNKRLNGKRLIITTQMRVRPRVTGLRDEERAAGRQAALKILMCSNHILQGIPLINLYG